MLSKKRQKLFEWLERFIKKERIDDIFIFGSFVKGKDIPNDIDICIATSNAEINEAEILSFFKKEGIDAHISKTQFALMLADRELWKSILHEGYSIRYKEFAARLIGMEAFVLVDYKLGGLSTTQKQIFSHALNGTGGRESFLKDIKAERVGRGALLVPNETLEKMRSFLDDWKADYRFRRVFM